MLGSITETVVRHSGDPVLVIRPVEQGALPARNWSFIDPLPADLITFLAQQVGDELSTAKFIFNHKDYFCIGARVGL